MPTSLELCPRWENVVRDPDGAALDDALLDHVESCDRCRALASDDLWLRLGQSVPADPIDVALEARLAEEAAARSATRQGEQNTIVLAVNNVLRPVIEAAAPGWRELESLALFRGLEACTRLIRRTPQRGTQPSLALSGRCELFVDGVLVVPRAGFAAEVARATTTVTATGRGALRAVQIDPFLDGLPRAARVHPFVMVGLWTQPSGVDAVAIAIEPREASVDLTRQWYRGTPIASPRPKRRSSERPIAAAAPPFALESSERLSAPSIDLTPASKKPLR